jgi:hypothetical protein
MVWWFRVVTRVPNTPRAFGDGYPPSPVVGADLKTLDIYRMHVGPIFQIQFPVGFACPSLSKTQPSLSENIVVSHNDDMLSKKS